jgi:hypothetical protein
MTNSFTETHETSQGARNAKGNAPTRSNRLTPPKPIQREERLKRPLNSRRTGEPNSSEGRARSSLNAVKHGGYVTAKSAGLGYRQILDELTQRINPVGAVEEGVVESIAIELFRLSMLGKLEVERLQSAVCAEVGTLALAQALDYPWAQTHPDELRNPPQLSTLRNRLAPYLESQLASLQAQCGASPSESYSRTIEALRLAVQDIAEGAGASDDETDDTHPESEDLDELDRHMRARRRAARVGRVHHPSLGQARPDHGTRAPVRGPRGKQRMDNPPEAHAQAQGDGAVRTHHVWFGRHRRPRRGTARLAGQAMQQRSTNRPGHNTSNKR